MLTRPEVCMHQVSHRSTHAELRERRLDPKVFTIQQAMEKIRVAIG